MVSYTASSLDDIAKHFRDMGARAATRADHTTGIEKKLLNREATIWGQAASMLRQTKLAPETDTDGIPFRP